MATPRGATRRARTADLLVTNQLLYRLSYDGISSVVDHNIPGMGCHHFKLHTGLELLLRRYHSSYPSLYALALRCQIHPRGITELFSPAPVQSVASVSQFNSRASHIICKLLPAAVLHHLQQEPRSHVSFQVRGGLRIVGRAGIEPATRVFCYAPVPFHQRKLYLLSYRPMVPGFRRARFYLLFTCNERAKIGKAVAAQRLFYLLVICRITYSWCRGHHGRCGLRCAHSSGTSRLPHGSGLSRYGGRSFHRC